VFCHVSVIQIAKVFLELATGHLSLGKWFFFLTILNMWNCLCSDQELGEKYSFGLKLRRKMVCVWDKKLTLVKHLLYTRHFAYIISLTPIKSFFFTYILNIKYREVIWLF
jgi:hypothetical protein